MGKFPSFAGSMLVYNEKWHQIFFDGDPFPLVDDYTFWKGLFDGLKDALR